MAYRNLFLKNGWQIGTFQDGRARLYGSSREEGLARTAGVDAEWAEVADLVVKAVEVERINLPGSKYLEQFAAVCHEVVTKYAPVESAERICAKITRYWKNDVGVRISVDTWTGSRWWTNAGTYGMAAPLSEEELRALLKHDDVVDIELPPPPAPWQASSPRGGRGLAAEAGLGARTRPNRRLRRQPAVTWTARP